MEGIESKVICLCLNAVWQPIGYKSVKDSIISLTSSLNKNGSPSFLAIDIQYEKFPSGEFNFSNLISMTPLPWDEWINLPIRDFDFYISTVNMKIRVPTAIVASNFSKMPMRTSKLNRKGVWNRDKGVCQYSGKKLSKDQATVDHIIPKNKGGKDSWDNMVLCDKKINFSKGNKFNHEVGLKLIKHPKEPIPTPASSLIPMNHQDWSHFFLK
jgi:5-methylcytosine-specific restriction endonuclease McrA